VSSEVVYDIDSDAFERLENYTRRWFISTFSNQNVEQPIELTFPGMSSNNPAYQKARDRVRGLYKQWKNRTLKEAERWSCDWVSYPEHKKYANQTDFRTLKRALNKAFVINWVEFIFPWARRHIAFNECSNKAKVFLKCTVTPNPKKIIAVFLNTADAFVQLVVRARLHYIYKQSNGKKAGVAKHCRQYLLAAIDGLHTAKECSNLTIDDFPLLADVAIRTPLKRQILNLVEDSDGSMGEETETVNVEAESVETESVETESEADEPENDEGEADERESNIVEIDSEIAM
jgi:hypothetical protein